MESPETWDALTARLACSDLDDPGETIDGLLCAGLVLPMTEAERVPLEAAIRRENEREITGPSSATRAAYRIRDARLASAAAAEPDPGAHRAAREALAFATNARSRACVACGTFSVEWWRQGRCRCGATRVVPRPDDTQQPCLACDGRSPVGSKYCEACGRPFAPPKLGSQTRVEVLDGAEVAREDVVDEARFTIGRVPGNHVVLPWPAVASRHVRVISDGQDWAIEDLGSPGGTFLDGRQVRGRVPIHAGRVFEIPPFRIRLTRLFPAQIVGEAVVREAERWTTPTFFAAEVQHRVARFCDALELATGPSFLDAQTLLPATEALLNVLLGSPPEVAIGGLGAALRARLLHAVRATRAAARTVAGSTFDHYDAFERLAALEQLVDRLPERLPTMTPAQLLARIEREASEWSQEATRACEGWQYLSVDDFEMWKGNRRWLSCFLTDLRGYSAAGLPDAHDALDAVERIAATALVDPDYPPPERSRAMLADRVKRLRGLLGPRGTH